MFRPWPAIFKPTKNNIKVLSWPEDGRSRPKHVVKYNLIVIIASCLDVRCVLTMHNILYKFDNTQRDDISQRRSDFWEASVSEKKKFDWTEWRIARGVSGYLCRVR